MKTQRLRAQVKRLQEAVAELARTMGVSTAPNELPDEYMDSLPIETKRAWLHAMRDWMEAHAHDLLRGLSFRERLFYPVPLDELHFDGKDQVVAAYKRWQAGDRPLPCGLKELATDAEAATAEAVTDPSEEKTSGEHL